MDDSDESYGSYGSDGSESDEGPVFTSEVRSAPRRKQSYTVISPVKLAEIQEDALGSVCSILGCSKGGARNLLMHNRWDTEALFGVMAERGEEALFKAAGLPPRQTTGAEPPMPGEEVTCNCCFCDVPVAEATAMECTHVFCNDCWRGHFGVRIREGQSRRIKCMAVKCGTHCDEEKVKALLADDPALLSKYETALLSSYIEDNSRVCWCPSVPHCGNAIQVEDPNCEPVCFCGHKFCFACQLEPHSPCTCEMWKMWKQKCQDDSETKNWMSANTKPCPKCGKPVEKNGGCNLVTCHCSQSFCWLCGLATGKSHTWQEISGHSCGRFKEEAANKANEAERNIKRYQHYFTRWEGHTKSADLMAKEIQERLQEKVEELETYNSQLNDHTWLFQAANQVTEARRILGYTYVFAFHMFGNCMFKDEITPAQNEINKNLFENQQQAMESLVEHMSGLLELPPGTMHELGDKLRLEVINNTVNLDKRLSKLYELIENELLGSLTFTPASIASYKGVRSEDTIQTPAVIAEADDDVIDLTDSPTASVPRGNGVGKRPRHG